MYDDSVLLSMRFPQKLWKIVNDCKTGAITWSLNGLTILLDYKKFQEEYLSGRKSIFKTNNVTSFIRQLNLYGFRKVTSHNRDPMCNSHNPDVHEFIHDNFQVGRKDLISKVCRRTGGTKRIKFSNNKIQSKESIKQYIGDEKYPHISKLQMCQFALTEALQEATRNYLRERYCEEIINNENIIHSQTSSSEDITAWLSSFRFNPRHAGRISDLSEDYNLRHDRELAVISDNQYRNMIKLQYNNLC